MKITSFHGEHRFLSNFEPCQVKYNGIVFPSVEHAYQAAKSNQPEWHEMLSRLSTAGEAKRAGRQMTAHRKRHDWEEVKLDVMDDLLRQKFGSDPFCGMLLSTGKAELIEGNHWNDRFWGVCDGHGMNHLGRLLMEIRADLREILQG